MPPRCRQGPHRAGTQGAHACCRDGAALPLAWGGCGGAPGAAQRQRNPRLAYSFSAHIFIESLLTQLPFIKYLSLYFYSCWKTYLATIPTSVWLLKIT